MTRFAATLSLSMIALRCSDPSVLPYPTGGLSDLAFDGVDDSGITRTIHLSDYYDPNGARLLVVRVEGGTWCGTCRWHAAHTSELRAHARVRVLDLVVGNRDNGPARTTDLAAWRALLDAPVATAIDPGNSLHDLIPAAGAALPLFVFVDTRTMKVVGQSGNPDPDELGDDVARALAIIDGVAAPAATARTLVDGFFHRNEWDMLRDVALPGAPPVDPTNAVADSSVAAALGKALFFDKALSPSGNVSCASCHDPQKQLSDGLPQAQGARAGSRRTPRIALAAFSRFQFWDGRADSLWSQALGPLENADEFASSRLFVAQRIASDYAAAYASAFSNAPLPDFSALPAEGKPGDAAYDALGIDTKNAVTRVFVNVGKSIAAFERTFRVAPNALDAYVAGDFSALSFTEKQGLSVFMGAGCMQCHWGPRLTDDAFHVTRTPTGRADGVADRGRADGISKLLASEFASDRTVPPDDAILGAFKTPSLRGVSSGTPYGHGGEQAALTDVMFNYGQGGLAPDDPRAAGTREPWLVRFDTTAQWSMSIFLKTLSGDPIVP